MQLNSIQVPSHPHPFPEIGISPQSTLLDSNLLPIQIMSHLNPGPYICLWTTTRWCFTSIPVLPRCISDPPRHHLKPIQVSICASNFHPGPAQRNSGHKILVSPSSMNRIHQGPWICISPQSRLHLNSIQGPIFTSHLHTSTHIKVSASSRSCLTSIQVLIFASHFHPGDVSPPSMSGKCSSATPRSHLKPILVRFISIQVLPHLHPGQKVLISSRSLYHLTSTQITHHILSVHEVCSSSPPMSSLNFIQSP